MAEYQASFREFKEEEEGERKVCLNDFVEEAEDGLDDGELLVIQRALSGLASQDGLEHRETIFHTRCTEGGKVS